MRSKFFFVLVFFWIPDVLSGMTGWAGMTMGTVHADRTEEARVIKIDKERYDTILERKDGQQWLLQHGRTCTSMSTEWPVQLLFDSKEVLKKIKVNFNELCDVYTATPIDGQVVIEKYIKSDNALVADYQFLTTDQGTSYRLDYAKGCRYLYELEGKKVYLYRGDTRLQEGKSKIFMPENRGSCVLSKVTALSTAPSPVIDPAIPAAEIKVTAPEKLAMPPIQYQAQNNQVYFYWDALPEGKVLHYSYAYSKFKLDPKDYDLKQLPNVANTKDHQLTVKNLANKQLYYFFFAPVTPDRKVGTWTTLQITPINTTKSFKNNPDFEPFDVVLTKETDQDFVLSWNKKDNVKKYRVSFYVDGRWQWMKDLSPDMTTVTIPKKSSYLNRGLRVTVSTLQIDPIGAKYSDGIYWMYKVKKK